MIAPTLPFGEERVFRPMQLADLRLAWTPLVFLPLSQTLQLTCRRWLMIPQVVLLGVAALVLIRGTAAQVDPGIPAAAGWLIASWAIFLLTLRQHLLHRDLAPT